MISDVPSVFDYIDERIPEATTPALKACSADGMNELINILCPRSKRRVEKRSAFRRLDYDRSPVSAGSAPPPSQSPG